MTEYAAVFLGGFLGSAHCVGMCGGLVALVGVPSCTTSSAVARQLTYGCGRIFTYSFLGAVAGFAGARLSSVSADLVELQRVFSVAAGAIMILIGAATLGLIRLRFRLPGGVERTFITTFKQFLGGPGRITVFLAGVCNGFLPCGLVYAFLSLALASGSSIKGAALLAVFGLGTLPAMTVVGCGSSMVSHYWRSRIYRVAACLVVVTGGVTIYRAMPGPGHSCCSPEPVIAKGDRLPESVE